MRTLLAFLCLGAASASADYWHYQPSRYRCETVRVIAARERYQLPCGGWSQWSHWRPVNETRIECYPNPVHTWSYDDQIND